MSCRCWGYSLGFGFNIGVSILKIARKVFAFAIQYYSTIKDYEGVVPLRAIPTAVLSWGGDTLCGSGPAV